MHIHKEQDNANAQPVHQAAQTVVQRKRPNVYQSKQGQQPPHKAKHQNVDLSAARNAPTQLKAYANPYAPTPPSTNGGYYNGGGKFLGNHDQANGAIYLVTNKKERKAISRAHRKGACTPLSEVRSAVELPSLAVRQAMAAAVERSNAPNTAVGDKEGGFHEEGGMFGFDRQGNEKIIPAKPGQYADPSREDYASINVFSGETSTNGLHIINGTYHVHPKGTVSDVNGETHYFKQAPSNNQEKDEGDIPNARRQADPTKYDVRGNSYVIGARDKTVYIYNGNGVVATMPLKHFIKIK